MPITSYIYYMQIAQTEIGISITENGKGPTFVVPHSNETTSYTLCDRAVRELGGRCVRIINHDHRRVTFILSGKTYSFDPNRIFTWQGIKLTLGKNTNVEAEKQIANFADVLYTLCTELNQPIIALHNNKGLGYTFKSYLKGGSLYNDYNLTFQSSDNPQNFTIVSLLGDYEKLLSKNLNLVYQYKPVNDGSMSVRFAMDNLPYFNIESAMGDSKTQWQDINTVVKTVK